MKQYSTYFATLETLYTLSAGRVIELWTEIALCPSKTSVFYRCHVLEMISGFQNQSWSLLLSSIKQQIAETFSVGLFD